jgi:hypothetical protein
MTIVSFLPHPVVKARAFASAQDKDGIYTLDAVRAFTKDTTFTVRETGTSGNLRLLQKAGDTARVIEGIVVEMAPVFSWDAKGTAAILAGLPAPLKDGDVVLVSMPAGQLVQAAVAAGGSTKDFFGADVNVCGPMTGQGQCTRDAGGNPDEVFGYVQYA